MTRLNLSLLLALMLAVPLAPLTCAAALRLNAA